jgi:BirA family biotin operon repressor/biotin-[acetyl-CoA-carboxylase] ligase
MKIVHLTETTSTMDEARTLLKSCDEVFVYADTQTAGRGRRGNQWVSITHQGLYCTYGRSLSIQTVDLSGLSLVIGVGLLEGLHLFDKGIRLKWPNDLVHQDSKKKLAGILIESSSKGQDIDVCIGIGLNLLPLTETSLENSVISLSELSSTFSPKPYNEIATDVGVIVRNIFNKFISEGFIAFRDTFHSYAIESQNMTIDVDGDLKKGRFHGVSARGELILHQGESTHTIVSGHVLDW